MARVQPQQCRSQQKRPTPKRIPGHRPPRSDRRIIHSRRPMSNPIIPTSGRGQIPSNCDETSLRLLSKTGHLRRHLFSRLIRSHGRRTRAASETIGATRKTTANGQMGGTQARIAIPIQDMSANARNNNLSSHNRHHREGPHHRTLTRMTRARNQATGSTATVGPMQTIPAQARILMITRVRCMRRRPIVRGRIQGLYRSTRRRGRGFSVTGQRRAA